MWCTIDQNYSELDTYCISHFVNCFSVPENKLVLLNVILTKAGRLCLNSQSQNSVIRKTMNGCVAYILN